MISTNNDAWQIAGAPCAPAIVQVTKLGATVTGSEFEFDNFRKKFQKQHWLLLPEFLDTSLLELIRQKLSDTDYRTIDRETGVEQRPVDCTAYLATELLLNDPKLFRAIEQVTGCGEIACFSGRIYRRPPSGEFFNRWHTDQNGEGRMVALSINLSTETYNGGALQIRSSETKELVCEVHNPRYGDAVIFPIDEKLEHRVCRVEAGAPKTALAGWFKSEFDPNSLFGRGKYGRKKSQTLQS